MNAPRYTVYYFGIRGRAEPIRLLLTSLGLPFEDRAVVRERWMEIKPTLPLGQVPVLYERDEAGVERAIPQSQAILRHLGRVHDRAGRDEDARLRADVVAETVHDARAVVAPVLGPVNRGKDPAALKAAFAEKLPPQLAKLESLATGGLLIGPEPTWADCVAFDALDALEVVDPHVLAPFPKLAAFVAAMRAWPTLVDYLATRRPSEMAPLREVLATGVAL